MEKGAGLLSYHYDELEVDILKCCAFWSTRKGCVCLTFGTLGVVEVCWRARIGGSLVYGWEGRV